MTLKKRVTLILTQGDIVFPNFSIALKYKENDITKSLLSEFEKKNNLMVITSFEEGIWNSDNKHYDYGTLVKITAMDYDKTQGIYTVLLNGLSRVKIKNSKYFNSKKIMETDYEVLEDKNDWTAKAIEAKKEIEVLLSDRLREIGFDKKHMKSLFQVPANPFSYSISSIIPLTLDEKLSILREDDVEKRLIFIKEVFNYHIEEAQNVANSINDKVRVKLTKQQKEFYLKEQLKAIKEELDFINGEESEYSGLQKRLDEGDYPDHIREKVSKELKRLESTPSSAPESNIIRSYIDWLLSLPYKERTTAGIDIKAAKKILDEDHYGLEKPKARIIEYLAVKKQNPNAKGSIIALIGPPGTGKTSFARSIARAMNKEFAKISLGGVKDESEIRGHRRTYIAAMPGKIIQAMRKVGVVNPVILLDEIDKMSSDFRGDPTSAMLEVLDYEQNYKFQDHYIEEEYDLSHVIFIATANYLEHIPEALFDRLEIINLHSYTELEKIHIAKNHLIKKVIKETNINPKQFQISDEILSMLIRHYTIEAGVRQLQRVLEEIARKIIVAQMDKKLGKVFKIDEKFILEFLGKKMYDFTKKEKLPQVGTTNGLAWTAYGGDILPIEVTLYPGKGDLIITGQLKDVMRESANIALSYIKANREKYEIAAERDGKDLFKDFDIHIHSPDGATPKDGPSAGVTFTTSIISALTGKTISQNIGMTGEITLRGKVLPIGGLKEKSISAFRSGLKLIFVPKENLKDLDEIPQEVKDNLKIVLIDSYDELYNYLVDEKYLQSK